MESDSIWIPWVHFLCSLHFIFFCLLILFGVSCRYTSKMLLAAIDEQCRGTYDFIYLPIDFKASEFSGGLTLVYNIMVHNAHMYMRLLIAFLFLSSN